MLASTALRHASSWSQPKQCSFATEYFKVTSEDGVFIHLAWVNPPVVT